MNWATSRPKDVAIVANGMELTWAEANDSALRLAHSLREEGVRPGEIVAVALPPLLEAIAIMSLLHEGAVSCTMPRATVQETDETPDPIFDWIIATESTNDAGRLRGKRTVVIDHAMLSRTARASAQPDPRGLHSRGDLCRIVYSSGTTGAPKGVPFTVETIRYRTRSARHHWMPLHPFMCLLPISTVSGFQTFYASLANGERYLAPGSASDNLRTLAAHDVRSIKASPAQLSELLAAAERAQESLPHLSVIQSAGSAMPANLAAALRRQFDAEVVNLYGSSESGTVAVGRETDGENLGAGRIVEDVRLQIVDDNHTVVPDGTVGHVRVARPHQPTGYVNNDDASRTSFRDGWFYPGDLGSVQDGVLRLHGRASDLVNAAGVKINPALVEARALGFAGIEDAAGCAVPGTHGVETFALAFVSRDAIDIGALSDMLRGAFEDGAPQLFVRVATIPRTDTGKVLRSQLVQELLRLTNNDS